MSHYLNFGPYTCRICKEQYDLEFAEEYLQVNSANPQFARFDLCECCGIKEAISSLTKVLEKDKGSDPHGIFRNIDELCSDMYCWKNRVRDKCKTCGAHERDGCRTHD